MQTSKIAAEDPILSKYLVEDQQLGENPKSNYYKATKKVAGIEDPDRAVKRICISNIQVSKGVALTNPSREIILNINYWKEAAKGHCHIIGLEEVLLDPKKQMLQYVPNKFMSFSLYDWIRRHNKNNIRLNKNNIKDKDLILFIQNNFASLARTILSVINHLHKCSLSYNNLKTENVLLRCDSKGFTRLLMTDLFLLNTSKQDRNSLFRMPVKADQTDANCLKNDLYAFGMLLLEFVTCQVIEKQSALTPDEVRLKLILDLEKDEIMEKYQKSLILQCLGLPTCNDGQEVELLRTFEGILSTEQSSKAFSKGEVGLALLKNKMTRVAMINTEDILDLDFGPLLCSTNKREHVATKIEVKKCSNTPLCSKVLLEERNRLEFISMLSTEKILALCRKPLKLLEIDLSNHSVNELSSR